MVKKCPLETRKSQLGGIYTRFCQYTAKISSEMDSSSQKNIVVHSKHIKFDEKMTKIEDSRISKMAAAAILNISFLPQLRKNGLVRRCSPKGP